MTTQLPLPPMPPCVPVTRARAKLLFAAMKRQVAVAMVQADCQAHMDARITSRLVDITAGDYNLR